MELFKLSDNCFELRVCRTFESVAKEKRNKKTLKIKKQDFKN